MSRLESGVLRPTLRPVALEEIVPLALDDAGPGGNDVIVRDLDQVPPVSADAGLLERVVANLIANALRHSPPHDPPVVTASTLDDRVELRVIDRGPGIPEDQREHVFRPFQRLGDRRNDAGLGLGLALSRGLVEAMHGSIEPEETPGGGLTMVIVLHPAASPGTAEIDAGHTTGGDAGTTI